uniref:Reverse transcriptase domain-containing protein n=1 Tax=Cuerna arida TaxID=1464854 RepID=A0A1B6F3S2_9HEMI
MDVMIRLFQTYLKGRVQVTKLGSEKSGPLQRQRGVPQGSCLGPILFNMYTSDLPGSVQFCSVHYYAYDCQLHLSYEPSLMHEAIDAINSDLLSIHKWSESNGLRLNVSKCTVLHTAPQELVHTLTKDFVQVILSEESLSVSDKIKTYFV